MLSIFVRLGNAAVRQRNSTIISAVLSVMKNTFAVILYVTPFGYNIQVHCTYLHELVVGI